MPDFDPDFVDFLLRAKRRTYASGQSADAGRPASRLASCDLGYDQGPYRYLDTYLGGFAFCGEEAVWRDERPVWAMNYYGTMTIPEIPAGFSDFLKLALRQAPPDAPYRGPRVVEEDRYTYHCRWEGDLTRFLGNEQILLDGQVIYTLDFHGGAIV